MDYNAWKRLVKINFEHAEIPMPSGKQWLRDAYEAGLAPVQVALRPGITLICPNCGGHAVESMTQYGVRHDCRPCRYWSHGGAPLTDARTHMARKEAHKAFDKLWSAGPLTRAQAYRLLAARLGVSHRGAHMGRMDYDTASRVPTAVEEIWADLPTSIR